MRGSWSGRRRSYGIAIQHAQERNQYGVENPSARQYEPPLPYGASRSVDATRDNSSNEACTAYSQQNQAKAHSNTT